MARPIFSCGLLISVWAVVLDIQHIPDTADAMERLAPKFLATRRHGEAGEQHLINLLSFLQRKSNTRILMPTQSRAFEALYDSEVSYPRDAMRFWYALPQYLLLSAFVRLRGAFIYMLSFIGHAHVHILGRDLTVQAWKDSACISSPDLSRKDRQLLASLDEC